MTCYAIWFDKCTWHFHEGDDPNVATTIGGLYCGVF